MQAALAAARQAAGRGEVPVGAVITGPDGALLAVAGNETEARQDSTAHAELLVIAAAQAPAVQNILKTVISGLRWSLAPCVPGRLRWPVSGGFISVRQTKRWGG